jgi:glycine dehydrogenase
LVNGLWWTHAAYFAKDEYKRSMPGRIIGVSQDAEIRAYVWHYKPVNNIKRERQRLTFVYCSLLSVMAGMFAVYHGPKG